MTFWLFSNQVDVSGYYNSGSRESSDTLTRTACSDAHRGLPLLVTSTISVAKACGQKFTHMVYPEHQIYLLLALAIFLLRTRLSFWNRLRFT